MRLRRILLNNKDNMAGEKRPFGKILKDYVNEHDPVHAEAYTKYEKDDLPGLFKKMNEDTEKGGKDRMSSDLVTLFSNFNITNPPEPQCMREKKLDPETTKKLDKAIADAALRIEIENIGQVLDFGNRHQFYNKVNKKTMVKHVRESTKEKFRRLDGKKVLEKLAQRLKEQGKEVGYDRETHTELAKVIAETLSKDGHDPLSKATLDDIATFCEILGENVREEKSHGLNRSLALVALKDELPANTHEPCFGTSSKA